MFRTARDFLCCIVIAIIAFPCILFAASFDCSKASTETEKAICSDSELSAMDEAMAVIYSNALKSDNSATIKNDQRIWLKKILTPCKGNRECIRNAYAARTRQLAAVSNAPVPAPPPPISTSTRTVVAKTKPLNCPQCGVWQGGSSEVDGIFVIERNRIILPGCEVFSYKTVKSKVLPEREDRHTYEVSLRLNQEKESFLCPRGKNDNWNLEANIDGHFQEGGTGSFILHRNKSAKPLLEFYGWNIDRENPCDAGSGSGTTACISDELSLVYQALARLAEYSYEQLMNVNIKKLPDFNPARFSATVDHFCTEREKESGGGSWPHAWALDCKLGFVKDKRQEFIEWKACMEKNENKVSACIFPTEDFDRTKEREVE